MSIIAKLLEMQKRHPNLLVRLDNDSWCVDLEAHDSSGVRVSDSTPEELLEAALDHLGIRWEPE